MQRLSVYTGEALEELEEVFGLSKPKPARKAATKKASSPRRIPAKKVARKPAKKK